MRRILMVLGATGWIATIGGCGITGSWRAVAIDPPGMPLPIETLTLDPNQQYTATWSEGEEKRTSTGQYRWNGLTLEVVQMGNMPRHYNAHLGSDGRLILTHRRDDARVVVRLEKVER